MVHGHPHDDLDSLTIPTAQALMDAGRLTSASLTAAYLNRIEAVDPVLNAVLALDPDAERASAASDARRRSGRVIGPLDGIPVLVKDNIATRGHGATAGSKALLGARPAEAELARRLREAGAVIIAKANLSEWANFRGSPSTSGWSALGGQTHNPHVLDRSPCGSSSGSGAGVAASLAQVAIGTETDGSIVCPAGQCGVVGVKPTVGLVPGQGIVPISAEQDTAGPMSRHVVDASLTLAVLAGLAPSALDADALRGKRIGVWRPEASAGDVDRVTETAVAALRDAGAVPVEVAPPGTVDIEEHEWAALLAEFKRDIERWLRETPGDHPATLAGLIAFNANDPDELRVFGQEIFEQAEASPSASSPAMVAHRRRARDQGRAAIDTTLADHDLRAVMTPTNGPAWPLDATDRVDIGTSGPAAISGYPNVTVPAGFVGPLPVGMSFMSTGGRDDELLSLSFAFEQRARARRPPGYLS